MEVVRRDIRRYIKGHTEAYQVAIFFVNENFYRIWAREFFFFFSSPYSLLSQLVSGQVIAHLGPPS